MSSAKSVAGNHLEKLREILGADAVKTSAEDLQHYGCDWTRFLKPNPSAIVFPKSTEEVSQLLSYCNQNRLSVVPSGGRTGLAGGALAAEGEIVLSLEKMNRMGSVDPATRTLRVQAGAVTEAVHRHCAPYELTWPIDFASKGSSHVGGNIATNAGGVRVIRYGLTRQWVLGLQVVSASGEILELNGELEKNNTGYDLRQLYIGSEGTLGVITEAILKLAPLPSASQVLFFGLEDLPSVLELFSDLRRKSAESGWELDAFEFLGENCLQSVLKLRKFRAPFVSPYSTYVLAEVGGGADPQFQESLESWLGELFEKNRVKDGTMAQSSQEAHQLWQYREGISESLSARGIVHKHDVSLPIRKLPGFVEELLSQLQQSYRNHEVFLFGHIGDGNLHINILKAPEQSREAFLEDCRLIDDSVYGLVTKYQGSISAEHGIGLFKKKALPHSRSPVELEIFRRVKRSLDPNGILNPGKIFDL